MSKLLSLALAMTLMIGSFAMPAMVFAQSQVEVGEVVIEQEVKPVQSVEVSSPKLVAVGMPQAPEGDPAENLANLVTNWKTISPLAKGALVILILIQCLKLDFFGGFFKSLEWKRAFITVLGIAYGVVYLVSTGTSWSSALIVGLLSSGGAVAIYQAIKPILPKKKATPALS